MKPVKDKIRWLSLYELLILMMNVMIANEDPDVGFEDARYSANGFLRKLNKRFKIEKADLESALWACNLLSEKGKFWHPSKYNFKEFKAGFLRGEKFNATYNYLQNEDKDESPSENDD